MLYQVTGIKKDLIVSKKDGKRYIIIGVISQQPDWRGCNAENIMLNQNVMEIAKIDNEAGDLYRDNDGKKYYVDIEYNNRGYINNLRFFSK